MSISISILMSTLIDASVHVDVPVPVPMTKATAPVAAKKTANIDSNEKVVMNDRANIPGDFDENGHLIESRQKTALKNKKKKKSASDGDSITRFDFNLWVESMANATKEHLGGWEAAKIRANEEDLLDCIVVGAGARSVMPPLNNLANFDVSSIST
jgi:hypothetical protein